MFFQMRSKMKERENRLKWNMFMDRKEREKAEKEEKEERERDERENNKKD